MLIFDFATLSLVFNSHNLLFPGSLFTFTHVRFYVRALTFVHSCSLLGLSVLNLFPCSLAYVFTFARVYVFTFARIRTYVQFFGIFVLYPALSYLHSCTFVLHSCSCLGFFCVYHVLGHHSFYSFTPCPSGHGFVFYFQISLLWSVGLVAATAVASSACFGLPLSGQTPTCGCL